MKVYAFLISLFLAGTLCSCNHPAGRSGSFKIITANQSGIHFQNKIENTAGLNILDYLYFYNGAGVAAGDIDGDGLCDLFFVSNTGENKLYKNFGNYRFKDITQGSGLQSAGAWKTGVCMADLNGDGLLDIYICRVSGLLAFKGHNELYINLGHGKFRESSHDYGLDISSLSTQAAFFDFDRDGDLDMVLISQAVHTQNSVADTALRHHKTLASGCRLFRNDRGHYVEVTDQAGLVHSPLSYSLGLAVGDINGDGWDDIYVSNDFAEDDYLFINQQNGTFKDQRKQALGHTSRFSMGNDLADVNGDGLPDILTLDMLPEDEKILKSTASDDPYDIYQYKRKAGYLDQYSRNCLQLNRGQGYFSEVGMLAGIEATDWSWSALIEDYNNDGLNDIFISSGILRRPNNLDYIKYISSRTVGYRLNNSRSADLEAISRMPEGKAGNHLYSGEGNLKFKDESRSGGFDIPGLSNGAVYCDLTNSGREDIVVNRINDVPLIYGNTADKKNHNYLKIKLDGQGKNRFGTGARLSAWSRGYLFYRELQATRGFESSVEPVIHLGLGASESVDSMRIVWADGSFQHFGKIKIPATITLHQKNAKGIFNFKIVEQTPVPLFEMSAKDSGPLNFVHRENSFIDFNAQNLLPNALSCEGPHLAVREKLLYPCAARGQDKYLYLLDYHGRYVRTDSLCGAKKYEDTDAIIEDFDGDGVPDLLVGSGGNEAYAGSDLLNLRFYKGTGKGFDHAINPLPGLNAMVSCLRIQKKDDAILLFVGARAVSGAYGKIPASHLINIRKGVWTDVTGSLCPELAKIGMVTDAQFADIDGDGKNDLVLLGDWIPVTLFLNSGHGFTNQTAAYGLSQTKGLWRSLICTDLDGDGKMDIIAGNYGLNSRYRPGQGHPLLMFAGDFGQSSQYKQILASWKNDAYYSINGKDELSRQMPYLNRKFQDYASFAEKPLDSIFDIEELARSNKFEAELLASTVFYQNPGKSFKQLVLPVEAQFSPVFAILCADLNGDGKKDILTAGNFKPGSMYNGNLDASTGELMIATGKRTFRTATLAEKGFLLKGDVRDLKLMDIKGKRYVIAARNDTSSINLVLKKKIQ